MNKHDIIVIGTSAGGVEALQTLVRHLPEDLPAAIFVVLHVARQATSVLPAILERAGSLRAIHPQSGQPIEHGMIYIAPPDHHLLIKPGFVTLSTGPYENGFRPSVNALFRTAADVYGPRVIGVVLSGLLDDGSAGLLEVKANGGLAVVQDPADAVFASMPQNAMKVVDVDYALPVAEIGDLLVQLTSDPIEEIEPMMDGKKDVAETAQAEHIYTDASGKISDLSCPDCGGVLVEYRKGQNGKLVSYECRVGHLFSLETMVSRHTEATEAALWAALRTLNENISLSRQVAGFALEANDIEAHQVYLQKARTAEAQAATLRQLLLESPQPE